MFHRCVFRHNDTRDWPKSRQPFTFSRHNVKNPPPRAVIKCGHWALSPAAGPICPNPSGPYPFVLMDANATNWLGTINLQNDFFCSNFVPNQPVLFKYPLCPAAEIKSNKNCTVSDVAKLVTPDCGMTVLVWASLHIWKYALDIRRLELMQGKVLLWK